MAPRLPLRLIPVLLCFPLLVIVEFRGDELTVLAPPPLYALKVGPLRLADLCILGLAALQWVIVRQRATILRLPRELAIPAFLAVSAWALAMAFGIMTGGSELFHAWRSVPLGAMIAWIVAAGVRTRDDLSFVWKAFLGFCALYSIGCLVRYAAGGGDVAHATGRIPLWDEKTLGVLSFASVLAFSLWLGNARLGRVSAVIYGLPCLFVVLLSMRRVPWVELILALGFILLLQGNLRRRAQAIAMVVLIAAVGVVAITPARLEARLRSLHPSARGAPESSTNQDHVNDIRDAWDIVKSSPVLGIGLGKTYRTNRIAAWKTESTLVHNGPMHVWVFYGVVGVIAYFSWHLGFFSYLARLRRRWRATASDSAPLIQALLGAVLAWSVAVFIGRTFFPPLHLSLQPMVLVGLIWGVVFQRSIRPAVHEQRQPVGAAT